MASRVPLAGLPVKHVLGVILTFARVRQERNSFVISHVTTSEWKGSRPSHLIMIIPNTKRHPNNTKTNKFPILR